MSWSDLKFRKIKGHLDFSKFCIWQLDVIGKFSILMQVLRYLRWVTTTRLEKWYYQHVQVSCLWRPKCGVVHSIALVKEMKKSTLASESFQIKEKGFHKLCGDHVIWFTNEAYQSQYYYCNWGLLCQISNKRHEIALGQTRKLKEKRILI